MSHFIVVVRIPASFAPTDELVEKAVDAMLAPFEEGTTLPEFTAFEDEEDGWKSEYESGDVEMVELSSDDRVYPWDDRLRVPGTFGTGSDTHNDAPGSKRVRVPHRERYESFEQFCADWHGAKARDARTGRYGHWRNPKAKWDWYTIGGRWRGYFPVRPDSKLRVGEPGAGRNGAEPVASDVVRLSEIDLERVRRESEAAVETFWGEWNDFIAGKEFQAFDGPRDRARRIGLLEVRQGPPLPGEEARAVPWRGKVSEDDPRSAWHDVYKSVTREEFTRDFAHAFCTIAPYATLDENGWHAPGDMGWLGSSPAVPNATMAHKKAFLGWLKETPADAWLVAVDCHI
jgi:hypothetical protein